MRKILVRILMVIVINSGLVLILPHRQAEASLLSKPALPAAAAQTVTGTETLLFLPVVTKDAIVRDVLQCSNPNAAIPENATVEDSVTLVDSDLILQAEVWVKIDHTYVGDVSVTLNHSGSQQEIRLMDRPGYPATETGCSFDNIYTIFSDRVSQLAEAKCRGGSPAISGMYLPIDKLDDLRGNPAAGDWTLRVSDTGAFDKGTLVSWCLYAQVSDYVPAKPSEPPVQNLPESASVYGIHGQHQALPLDCESRSAVDWAAFFGKNIYELTFYSRLPVSDNPDKGFVGSVYGTWGQVPPYDYGIHAGPVAALLRGYGLPAEAGTGLKWDDIRAEIASGQPVIVWVEGYIRAGRPRFYISPSDGEVSIVAPYEHTVIVVGYNANFVSILNGSNVSSVPINSFLDAWATLGNMAIRYR